MILYSDLIANSSRFREKLSENVNKGFKREVKKNVRVLNV